MADGPRVAKVKAPGGSSHSRDAALTGLTLLLLEVAAHVVTLGPALGPLMATVSVLSGAAVGDPALSRARSARGAAAQIEALTAAQAATATSERAYRELFDRSPVGIGILDDAGRLTSANDALCRMTGRTKDQLLGRAASTVLEDVTVSGGLELSPRWDRRQITRPDGSTRQVEVNLSPGAGPTFGKRDCVVVHVRDVSEQVEAEQALWRARADLTAVAAVVRQMASGQDVRTLIVEAARDIAEANTVYMLEPDAGDLVITAQSGPDLLGVRVGMDSVSVTAAVWRTGDVVFLNDPENSALVSPALLELSGARSMMWQPVTSAGQVRGILAVTWPTRVSGLDDRAAQAVALIAAEAATALEREQLLASLRDLATTDPLTGLANRRSWDQALGAAMDRARRDDTLLCVAIMDVDHFKSYNDTHGHNAGDDLLRTFGHAATSAVRRRRPGCPMGRRGVRRADRRLLRSRGRDRRRRAGASCRARAGDVLGRRRHLGRLRDRPPADDPSRRQPLRGEGHGPRPDRREPADARPDLSCRGWSTRSRSQCAMRHRAPDCCPIGGSGSWVSVPTYRG